MFNCIQSHPSIPSFEFKLPVCMFLKDRLIKGLLNLFDFHDLGNWIRTPVLSYCMLLELGERVFKGPIIHSNVQRTLTNCKGQLQ